MKKRLIVCRFNCKEYKLLKRLAKENNMSVRKYIKKLILDYIN
ncbi:hypothetical protein OFR22_11565 [Brachyspira hyodysenteriae]|nr:hypothetical protein [Brachyspira hyodysenteriae]MCZ9852439.1 hypothetical protein [Brachyspira hyodysenteriae]MCZ9869706.1 hypothetical protein [Brachyspira hyodysenteriae]MCZ9874479.1 hypothetical protein [Brachyspira hyodysenteriae]MCZ9879398.1 hypothetical protein [Brachyspira hyodysenteriae]MCZ9893643.1 hypothetical protein [Brachyspira hyodysenteriae]